MARANAEFAVYVGPQRGDVPLPLTAPGADWTPITGWTDVTTTVAALDCRADEHQHVLTITLAGWALDSGVWLPDRQVIVRLREWDDTALTLGAWRVVFAGYCSGEASGEARGTADGVDQSGTLTCVQEWAYLALTRTPAVTFGRLELARGRPATANTTLSDPSQEAPQEYASALTVDASQAVDGNRDTCWIGAAPANPNPPAPWNTGKVVKVMKVYDGTGGVGTVGANGGCRAIELACNDIGHFASFESGFDGYTATGGGRISRSTAWKVSGAWSLVMDGPGGTRIPDAGGATYQVGGLTPEAEVDVSFWMVGYGGWSSWDVLIGGGVLEPSASPPTRVRVEGAATQARRFIIRKPAGKHGTLSIRWKFVDGAPTTLGAFVDDVRFIGGVDLEQSDNKGLYLAFDDRRGNTGQVRMSRALNRTLIGGNRPIVLCDDAELFRAQFDPGDGADVVQWRTIGKTGNDDSDNGLTTMDVASKRGRLTLAMYRRFPDLPGQGGAIWDDMALENLPAFLRTEGLRRTGPLEANFVVDKAPAFGGAATVGVAWLKVDLGSFAAPALTVALSTSGGVQTVTLDSTAALPQWGNLYIENELVWANTVDGTTLSVTRTAPVGHAVGALVYPQVDGVKVTLPLLAAVGIRRRPGTPALRDFQLIGSTLPGPRAPDSPDQNGGVWGGHADWFNLGQMRNNTETDATFLIGRDGQWYPTAVTTGATQGWGRQVRWLMLVIDRMADDGRPKVNELLAWAADLASGASGEWAGTNPPDLRGVVGHILTQHGGLTPTQFRIDRGDVALNLPWGAHYGQLQIAPGTADEVLSDLEAKGMLRIYCEPGGTLVVIPDPLATASAFRAPERTWFDADIWRLSPRLAAAHAVAQVIVSARNEDTQTSYRAAFPRSCQRYGRVEDVSGVLFGTQSQTVEHAIRVWRQRNAPASVGIETGSIAPLTLYARHIVTTTAADRAGLLFSGANFYVADYGWRAEASENGIWLTISVSLNQLAPYG